MIPDNKRLMTESAREKKTPKQRKRRSQRWTSEKIIGICRRLETSFSFSSCSLRACSMPSNLSLMAWRLRECEEYCALLLVRMYIWEQSQCAGRCGWWEDTYIVAVPQLPQRCFKRSTPSVAARDPVIVLRSPYVAHEGPNVSVQQWVSIAVLKVLILTYWAPRSRIHGPLTRTPRPPTTWAFAPRSKAHRGPLGGFDSCWWGIRWIDRRRGWCCRPDQVAHSPHGKIDGACIRRSRSSSNN